MEPVIDFNNVTKEYPLYHHIGSGIKDLIFHPKRAFQLLKGRKYLAIQDVSFTVGKGEAVALIGRNGAGKSTSLGLVLRRDKTHKRIGHHAWASRFNA